jgi:tetratricopeptide (TPR) repeat protein
VEKIAERLTDRFRLLTGGDRTALPRQQTLRALIDWSYELLSNDERTLFGRFSVFVSGFTLEAAEAVGASGAIGNDDVLDLLSLLVDKSLVERDASGERYRLLETVRQYAQEKLDASGEAGSAHTLHLDYFLAFAKRVQPELYGAEQGKWLARLDLDRENILAAHAWCGIAGAEAERGLQLATLVQLYWLPRGLIELGHRVTAEALARAGAQTHANPRRGALYAASQLAYFMGAFEKSKGYAEESVAIAREIEAANGAADALLILGYASDALGERAAAQAHFEESVAIARALGDKGRQSFALNALAGHHSEAGDLHAALPLFEESVALARELSDHDSVAIGLPSLAKIAIEQGSAPRARALILEALEISQEIGSTRAGHQALEVAAEYAILRAEWTRAAQYFGAVEAQMEQLGLRRAPADAAFLAERIGKARQALGHAAFAAAEDTGRLLSFDGALAEAREWLAD